jgi:O-antigen/teichoic acid export membrane protein
LTNTKTIARNTGWFGLENAISQIVNLSTSIAINRYLGPDKNGYLVYVSYLAWVVSSLGSMGIPASTRKYMAEFIGLGDRGTARYIYLRTLTLQTCLATVATSGLLIWVLRDAQGDYKLASALIVLSIWPQMVNFISAQAIVATEDLSANMPASVLSAATYFVLIVATVVLKWGVVGVGAALLTMRLVDLLVRFFPTIKRVLSWPTTHAHPDGVRNRMLSYTFQGVVSMMVSLVVWDRSEVILLRHFSSDIRQVSFYSVAFTMSGTLLLAAIVFGSAASTTIFAQYGRDKSRLPAIAASSFRYLALLSIPLHFIFAALAVPALLLVYGHKFEGAEVVVTLAPLLCVIRAFGSPAQSLLESAESQAYVIVATALAGIVDLGLAWYLIVAGHGAVGACIGNGAGQFVAIFLMWMVALHFFKVKLPWLHVGKIVLSSALAALAAWFIVRQLPSFWALPLGLIAALVVLLGLFYLLRVLEEEDQIRLNTLVRMLPKPAAGPAGRFIALLTRPEAA